jgi:3'-5' exoribonuclease
MILEAELLHYIDLIDARVYDYENALKNVEKGAFSEPVWSLDRRRLYKTIL